MNKKQRIPLPKADPRYPAQGSPTDMEQHPMNTGHPLSSQVLGDTFSALGPKAAYSAETNQMNQAVGVSSSVPRGDE